MSQQVVSYGPDGDLMALQAGRRSSYWTGGGVDGSRMLSVGQRAFRRNSVARRWSLRVVKSSGLPVLRVLHTFSSLQCCQRIVRSSTELGHHVVDGTDVHDHPPSSGSVSKTMSKIGGQVGSSIAVRFVFIVGHGVPASGLQLRRFIRTG